MRLYNTIFICKALRPGLDLTIKNRGNGDGVYTVTNWKECRRSLAGYEKISCLSEMVKKAYLSLPEMEREKDDETIAVSEPRKRSFEKELQSLKIAVDAIIRLYDSLELGEAKSGLDIRIPQCDTLADYIDILQEIDFVLTQYPYITREKEQIKFKSVDVGSQWLTFAVGAVIAGEAGYRILSHIGSLVHKAIDIKTHILIYRQQEEYLAEEQAKRELQQETVEFFKSFKRDALEKAVAELQEECGELADGEEKGKVSKCLEKLVVLIDKGVDICSSIEAPKEIKASFSMSEDNALLSENMVKLIEDKISSGT